MSQISSMSCKEKKVKKKRQHTNRRIEKKNTQNVFKTKILKF